MPYYLKYQLCTLYWRNKVDLTKIKSIIEDAIREQFPNAKIKVAQKYFYFEIAQKPTRGELISIGIYISQHSPLYQIVKEYESKSGEHPPSRKLFECFEKNF